MKVKKAVSGGGPARTVVKTADAELPGIFTVSKLSTIIIVILYVSHLVACGWCVIPGPIPQDPSACLPCIPTGVDALLHNPVSARSAPSA